MPQTSIADPARAFAGMIPGLAPKVAITLHAEDTATQAISAGYPVLWGTADSQALGVTDGATVDATTIAGFVTHDPTAPSTDGTHTIEDGDALSILRFGVMYLVPTETVAQGAAVCVGVATAALGDIGDTDDATHDPVPGARWLEDGTAGTPTLAMINLA